MCNGTRPEDDQLRVRALGFWLSLLTGVAGGYLVGTWLGWEEDACPLAVGAALVAGAGAAAGAVAVPRAAPMLPLAALSLAVARGLAAGAGAPVDPQAVARGRAPRLREVRVASASRPGPRCRVQGVSDAGQPVVVWTPPSACPVWRGERLAVSGVGWSETTLEETPRSPLTTSARHVWHRPPSPVRGFVDVVQRRASEAVARVRQFGWDVSRGKPGLGLVVSATQGVSAALPPAERASLQRAGLGHIVAVSGLHVGMVAVLLQMSLRWLTSQWVAGPVVAVVAAACPVAVYVALSGAGAPALRAALMLGLASVGGVLGRPVHARTGLAVAGCALLLWRPGWLVEPGFQLSMVAMATLLAMPRGASGVLTSWQLSWALLPLLWLHFDASSDGSVLANVLGVPVFSLWVVPVSLAGWALAPVVGGAALEPAALGADLLLAIADAVDGLPSIPRGVWVVGAVVALIPRLDRHLSPARRPWIPHRPAALLLTAVALWTRPKPPRAGWYAWQRGRSAEVLVVDTEGSGCLRDPSGGASRWRKRLQQHGVVRVLGVQERGAASVAAPHREALLTELRRHAWIVPRRATPGCRLPDRTSVSAALRRCAAFSAPAAARLHKAGLQCWSARTHRWRDASPEKATTDDD